MYYAFKLWDYKINLCNEKSVDLHIFTGNKTNGIVTVNGYHKQ